MSHEGNTQFPSGSSPPPQQFSTTASGFNKNNVPLTALEQWAIGRSDTSFRAVAGACAGIMSGIVTCPLDVIKTKLQAQGGFRNQSSSPQNVVYRGLIGTGRVIWREEGLRGMYRGLGPIILGYLPTWAVWFTVYGRSKEYFEKSNDSPMLINFYSSIVAGASSTMVTNPIWVIKTRLMSQVSSKASSQENRPPWHYRSTMDAFKKMYRTEGILSFYSGLTPALLGLTHVAVQFPAYEYLKTKFTGVGMGKSNEGDIGQHYFGVFAASFLSKVLASSATYPHEVIRTRLQTQQRTPPAASSDYGGFRAGLEGHDKPATVLAQTKAVLPRYKGIVTTFKVILREEGWRAFYAGMGTNLMRAVPAATTTMLTFEYVMKHFNQAKVEGLKKSETNGW